MSEFQDFLQYVKQYPSIEVVVVAESWSSLRIFANTFPDIPACALSNLHRYEFKGPNQLIVLTTDMTSHMFSFPKYQKNDYDKLHSALSQQSIFDATVVFLNSSGAKFCLGGLVGRNTIEQLWECPIPQNNTVPSIWQGMLDNYTSQIQKRRLNSVLEHDKDAVTHSKKKM